MGWEGLGAAAEGGEVHVDEGVEGGTSEVVDGLMPEVADYEPRTALDGEADGLYYYRRIVARAPAYLKEGGALVLEIGHDQGEDLETLLSEAGFTKIRIEKDLAGLDRIACGTWRVPRLG